MLSDQKLNKNYANIPWETNFIQNFYYKSIWAELGTIAWVIFWEIVGPVADKISLVPNEPTSTVESITEKALVPADDVLILSICVSVNLNQGFLP